MSDTNKSADELIDQISAVVAMFSGMRAAVRSMGGEGDPDTAAVVGVLTADVGLVRKVLEQLMVQKSIILIGFDEAGASVTYRVTDENIKQLPQATEAFNESLEELLSAHHLGGEDAVAKMAEEKGGFVFRNDKQQES